MKTQQIFIGSSFVIKQAVVLILVTLLTSTVIPQTQNVDVFPLKSGLSYSYKFYSYSSNGDEMITSTFIDSGRVFYLILDSSLVNDSTIEWKISEIRDFSREKIQYSPIGGYDSTFAMNDTLQYVLKEYLSGKHKIYSSATVWYFPLRHIRNEAQEFVYRIYDSLECKLIFNWSNQFAISAHGSGYDTVFLSSTYGLYRRSFSEQWTSGYLSGSNVMKIEMMNGPTGVSEKEVLQPVNTYLLQNYPNPINPNTTFVFHLKDNEYASLKIYDILGNEIATVIQGNTLKGVNEFHWFPQNISSGLYLYQLQTNNYTETKKLLYLK